jgi:Ankyrin repeats (3 copies)/Ankyrin repeat
VEFKHIGAYFVENPPTITDADGKVAKLPKVGAEGAHRVHSITVLPGKEVVLYQWNCGLLPIGGTSKNLYTIHGTGKFSFQCERIVGPTLSNPNHPDPKLDKLATGKLELEVKEAKKSDQEKEGFTAWGKEVGGLQAGLGFRPGENRVYHHGEGVAVVLRVRNVGKEAVEFSHIWAFFAANPPAITGADGKVIQLLPGYRALGRQAPRSANVAPGKEVELYEWSFDLRPQGESGNNGSLTRGGVLNIHGSGKFSLQCERIVGPTMANPNHPNPAMSKLATGKLELEVKEKEVEKLPEKKQEKEAFTAWGKEVGGLQAGVSLRPDEKRVLRHGDVITLAVRVRNVGKEAVKFEYVRQFLDEELPTVANADGAAAKQLRLAMLGFHVPMEVTLEPGKEIELESRLPLRYELRPPNDEGKPVTKERKLFVGAGKVSIQYDRVLGSSSSGAIKLDPALSKLGTGKLELEIKADPPPQEQKKAESDDEEKAVRTYVDELRAAAKVSGQEIYNVAIRPMYYKSVRWAARKGEDKLVMELYRLYLGLPENAEPGGTALTWAAAHNDAETVKILLDRGLDVNAADDQGRTALHRAISWGPHNVGRLLEKGAKVNVKTKSGETPLMLAAQAAFSEVVTALLERKAEVNAQDAEDRTALMYAAKAGRLANARMSRTLPSRFAHSDLDVDSSPREQTRIGRGAVGMTNGYNTFRQILADFDFRGRRL